jgi:hypothetical protein
VRAERTKEPTAPVSQVSSLPVRAMRLEGGDFKAAAVEVEDPGRGGMIAPRPSDLLNGGGFGLNVADSLSESWGVERSSSGTRVWTQLAHAA